MTVDPTDPEIIDDDISIDAGADPVDVSENDDDAPGQVSLEAPEADTAEQYADLAPTEESVRQGDVPLDVNEADLAEQSRIVDLDEDDYR